MIPRDTLWLPRATVYTTHDAAGRPHACPASARLASDPEFAERVRVRTAERLARSLTGKTRGVTTVER